METEKKALEILTAQEEMAKRKRDDLEAIVTDSSKGIVARNKANAELAILKSENSGLRTERIKRASLLKRMNDTRSKSKQATVEADNALEGAKKTRIDAISLRESAMNAAREAEDRIPSVQAAIGRIEATLKEIMKKHDSGRGTIFFIQAELNEQRKFLPKSQFVVAQKKAEAAISQSLTSVPTPS